MPVPTAQGTLATDRKSSVPVLCLTGSADSAAKSRSCLSSIAEATELNPNAEVCSRCRREQILFSFIGLIPEFKSRQSVFRFPINPHTRNDLSRTTSGTRSPGTSIPDPVILPDPYQTAAFQAVGFGLTETEYNNPVLCHLAILRTIVRIIRLNRD